MAAAFFCAAIEAHDGGVRPSSHESECQYDKDLKEEILLRPGLPWISKKLGEFRASWFSCKHPSLDSRLLHLSVHVPPIPDLGHYHKHLESLGSSLGFNLRLISSIGWLH